MIIPKSLIAVIGDVHHHIGLAVEGLERIESELNRPIDQVFSVGDLVASLKPKFVCCGHHHTPADFFVGSTRVLALKIISTPDWSQRHIINPDWCALFEWDEAKLNFLQTWPKYLNQKRKNPNR